MKKVTVTGWQVDRKETHLENGSTLFSLPSSFIAAANSITPLVVHGLGVTQGHCK